MKFRPVPFADYILLQPLAPGGMAEVYLARRNGSAIGGNRLLVVKKIAAESSTDPEFQHLFKQEVTISLSLSHPNIVQTYDYGLADGQYFLSLEYVAGMNLGQLCKELASRKAPLPFEISCYIISQVCNALAYTHAYRDPFSGEHKSIIHRDISPQNIMVGQIGSVKLFDFGIAKIEDQRGVTKTGMIRGKLAYLSPEQAAQKELDGRSDLFTVGVVFWELLAGRRLFEGKDPGKTISRIMNDPIPPPSEFNRQIPAELDRISLKALERDKIQRYQLAQDFSRDLHHFVQQRKPGFGPEDLFAFLKKNFEEKFHKQEEDLRLLLNSETENSSLAEDGERTRAELVWETMEKSAELSSESGLDFESLTESRIAAKSRPSHPSPGPAPARAVSTNYSPSNRRQKTGNHSDHFSNPYAYTQRRSNPFFSLLTVLLIFGGLVAGVYHFSSGTSRPDPKSGLFRRLASLSGSEKNKIVMNNPFQLKVVSDKPGYSLTIDGQPAEVENGMVKVPSDRRARIRAELPGHEAVEWEYFPGDLGVKAISFTPLCERGLLNFTTTPGSNVSIFRGSELLHELETPVENLSLTAGSYHVVIKNELMNYKSEMNIEILKNRTTRISKTLK